MIRALLRYFGIAKDAPPVPARSALKEFEETSKRLNLSPEPLRDRLARTAGAGGIARFPREYIDSSAYIPNTVGMVYTEVLARERACQDPTRFIYGQLR